MAPSRERAQEAEELASAGGEEREPAQDAQPEDSHGSSAYPRPMRRQDEGHEPNRSLRDDGSDGRERI